MLQVQNSIKFLDNRDFKNVEEQHQLWIENLELWLYNVRLKLQRELLIPLICCYHTDKCQNNSWSFDQQIKKYRILASHRVHYQIVHDKDLLAFLNQCLLFIFSESSSNLVHGFTEIFLQLRDVDIGEVSNLVFVWNSLCIFWNKWEFSNLLLMLMTCTVFVMDTLSCWDWL